MILQVFAVHDRKVGAYQLPMFMRTKLEVIRAFSDVIVDPKSEFSKHPEDYMVVHLGEFSDETGLIVSLERPVPVVSGLECISEGARSA